MFPTTQNYEYYMYLPVLLALPSQAARAKSSPPIHFRRSVERQPASAVHIIICRLFVVYFIFIKIEKRQL